jgi:3-oxoacyl-[acyl-carrier-protein] synthase II
MGDEGPDWRTFFRNRNARNPNFRRPNDHLAVLVARQNGCGGPVINVSSACAGAAQAIGMGFRMVRRGEIDCMLVGGADSVLNLPTMIGLHLLGAPSTSQLHGDRLSRPFDRQRSGLVAGEGAGMVLLESEAHARARGATIYGEVVGYGSSLDAYGVTAPHPDGAGAVLAMSKALDDAGIAPQAIDCINAHGTSTILNDPIETKAIKRVFADAKHYRRIPVTANKSMFGHLIAAAGAPEFIATTLTVKFGVIPPTLNLDNPDPACDLDYVPHIARIRTVEYALSNSFGFGGLNAALVVKRHGNE